MYVSVYVCTYISMYHPVSMGKYGYERISSGLAPVVDPFPWTDPSLGCEISSSRKLTTMLQACSVLPHSRRFSHSVIGRI